MFQGMKNFILHPQKPPPVWRQKFPVTISGQKWIITALYAISKG